MKQRKLPYFLKTQSLVTWGLVNSMAVPSMGIDRVRGQALARLRFSARELGSLKLNSHSVFMGHKLNAMSLALLLLSINSQAGAGQGLC